MERPRLKKRLAPEARVGCIISPRLAKALKAWAKADEAFHAAGSFAGAGGPNRTREERRLANEWALSGDRRREASEAVLRILKKELPR